MREHVVHLHLDVGVEGASGFQSSSSLGQGAAIGRMRFPDATQLGPPIKALLAFSFLAKAVVPVSKERSTSESP